MATNDNVGAPADTIPFLAQPGPAPDPIPFAAPTVATPQRISQDAIARMSQETLSERAIKNHLALGDNSPGPAVLQKLEEFGELDSTVAQYASRAALENMQSRQAIVRQVSSDAAAQGRPLSTSEQTAIYNLSNKDFQNFSNDPKHFLDREYAQRVTDLAAGRNTSSPFDVAVNQNPNETLDTMNRFTDIIARREGFTKIAQEAEATAKNQSWGGYLVDVAKDFVPFYSWYKYRNAFNNDVVSSTLPGSALSDQVDYLYRLPADSAVKEARLAIMQLMQDNPQKAAIFANALLSYSNSDRFWDNALIAGIDVATVAPVGLLAKGTRNVIASTKAGTLLKDAGVAVGTAAGKTAGATARLADALKDLGRAATMRNITPAKVADAAGDVLDSATMSTSDKLEAYRATQGGLPVTHWKQLDNELMTLLDPERVLDGPRYNMSSEGARRLVEDFKSGGQEMVKRMFIDPLQSTYRTTPEVLKVASQEAFERFATQYRRAEDAIIDVERQIGETAGINVRIAKNNSELFETAAEASITATHIYGIPKTGFAVKGRGDKYYIEVFRPLDLSTDAVKQARIKDVTIQTTAKTPVGNLMARWLTKLRSADDVIPQDVREAFKRATYGGSKLVDLVQQEARIIGKLKDNNDFLKFIKYQQTVPDPADPKKLGAFSKTLGAFEQDFHAKIGRLPNEQEARAYFAYTRINDTHFMYLNHSWHADKISRGLMEHTIEEVSAKLEGKLVKAFPSSGEENAKVLVLEQGKSPKIINTKYSTGEDKAATNGLVNAGGYQVVQLSPTGSRALYEAPEMEKVLKKARKGGIDFIVVKNVQSGNIPYQQIPYRGGGHHMLPEGYFVRQAQLYTSEKGSIAKYYGDTNILHAPDEATAKEMATRLQKGQDLLRDTYRASGKKKPGVTDVQVKALDAWVKANLPLSPKAFKELYLGKNAYLDMDLPIRHSQSDIPLDKAYDLSAIHPKARFVKDSDGPYNLYKGMQNIRFGMERGDTIQAVANTGTKDNPLFGIHPAQLMEPMQALDRSIRSMTSGRYLDELRIGTAERFVAEFGDLLDLKNPMHKNDPFLAATSAPFLEGLTGDKAVMKNAAEAYRDRWLQFMGVSKSADEKFLEAQATKILGDISPDLMKSWQKPIYQILTDPVSPFDKMKQIAFHAKIGLFNVKQIFTQGAAWAHIVGISGAKTGTQAGLMAMMQNLILHRGDDLLEPAAGLIRKLGFNNKEQFLEATRALERTGFDHVGREVATREQHINARVIQTQAGKILDDGLYFFKAGESFIRRSAWNAAYLEWRTLEPTAKMSDTVVSRLLDRADLLAGNMSQASNAAYQRGVMSIPTQFMTYQIRLAEQLMGKRLTREEKTRLLFTLSATWGIPGTAALYTLGLVPFTSQLKEHYASKGIILNDTLAGQMVQGGLADIFAGALFGENVNASAVYGPTGQSTVFDMMSGKKTAFEAIMGASGSVFGQEIAAVAPFVQALWTMVNPYSPEVTPLQPQDFLNLVSPISSVHNLEKGLVAAAAGRYYNRRGEVVDQATNNWFAEIVKGTLGVMPSRIEDMYTLSSLNKDRQELIKSVQTRINPLMRKMFEAGSSEDKQAYHRQAMALLEASGLEHPEKLQVLRGYLSSNSGRSIMERQMIKSPDTEGGRKALDALRKQWTFDRNGSK